MAELSVDAVVLRQHSVPLYLFSMNSGLLNRVAYVTPRSHDAPEEIQRLVKKSHVRDIADYLEQPGTLLPTAIILSLEDDVKVLDTAYPNRKTIVFPSDEGKYAYILDGQHRMRAFSETSIDFDLPVVALHGADDQTRVKVFADVNGTQEQVDKGHIVALYFQIGGLSTEDSALMAVIEQLNSMTDSPLKGMVRMLPDDKKGVKNHILMRFLRPAVHGVAGGLIAKPTDQQAVILKEYLKGVQGVWPQAWDRKGFVLSESAGLEVMLGVFPAVKHRVDLHHGKNYTRDTFRDALRPLEGIELETESEDGTRETRPLDWSKATMRSLTNSQRGRDRLISMFGRLLQEADERESGA